MVKAIIQFFVAHHALFLSLLVIAAALFVLYIYNRKPARKKRFKVNEGANADHHDTVYNKTKKSSYDTLREVGSVAIAIIAVILILDINGVDVTTSLAGLGIAGTIIGLAMQDFLKDAIMGLRIVGDEFFSTGDYVRINNITGIVVHFSLLSTKIENFEDHSVYTICNGQITIIEKITNLLDVDIPFPYETSHRTAKDCVQHICARIWMLEGVQNCYYKGVEEFASSAVVYKLRCFAKPDRHPDLKREIQGITREVLAEEGIAIPFNQLDVHMIKN